MTPPNSQAPVAGAPATLRTVVVKVGSSSVTTPAGGVDEQRLSSLGAQVAALHSAGHVVVLVTSGAIAAGWSALGRQDRRSMDTAVLQAVSAVGQLPLMQTWHRALMAHGLHAGQVLLTPLDLVHRRQYLRARGTLAQLVALGVVPVVNENDAIADEEIRFGDNDRLAALVAHLVRADLLVLLTDAPGLLTADPRHDPHASLVEEVVEIDRDLEEMAGGAGSAVGSGGMASKLAAAKIAMWSGIRTVIADAARPDVLEAAVAGSAGVGTVFRPAPRRLPARKLWIAFAVSRAGTLMVDDGARRAVEANGRSLLAAGVRSVSGDFEPDDVVDVADTSGRVFARGLVRYPAASAAGWVGRRSDEVPEGYPPEVIHRDDLVVLSEVEPSPRPLVEPSPRGLAGPTTVD